MGGHHACQNAFEAGSAVYDWALLQTRGCDPVPPPSFDTDAVQGKRRGKRRRQDESHRHDDSHAKSSWISVPLPQLSPPRHDSTEEVTTGGSWTRSRGRDKSRSPSRRLRLTPNDLAARVQEIECIELSDED